MMPEKQETSKREQLLQVPVSGEEMQRLDEITKEVGWSRSAVVRFAWGLLGRKEIAKMKDSTPPGNRRRIATDE